MSPWLRRTAVLLLGAVLSVAGTVVAAAGPATATTTVTAHTTTATEFGFTFTGHASEDWTCAKSNTSSFSPTHPAFNTTPMTAACTITSLGIRRTTAEITVKTDGYKYKSMYTTLTLVTQKFSIKLDESTTVCRMHFSIDVVLTNTSNVHPTTTTTGHGGAPPSFSGNVPGKYVRITHVSGDGTECTTGYPTGELPTSDTVTLKIVFSAYP